MHKEAVLFFDRRVEAEGGAPGDLGACWVFVDLFIFTTLFSRDRKGRRGCAVVKIRSDMHRSTRVAYLCASLYS